MPLLFGGSVSPVVSYFCYGLLGNLTEPGRIPWRSVWGERPLGDRARPDDIDPMQKILPQVFHWTTFHEGIRQDVHSYCYVGPKFSVLIDPMVPADGLDWFRKTAKPEHVFLTNRLHYRGCAEFVKAFGVTVWCHSAGLHEFTPGQKVRAFEHGAELPGGIRALKVGSLCPEETALLLPSETEALALGDAVIRENDVLEFVPDELMGDDPVQDDLKKELLGG